MLKILQIFKKNETGQETATSFFSEVQGRLMVKYRYEIGNRLPFKTIGVDLADCREQKKEWLENLHPGLA